jgi:MATE family multidrug resistance protein
MEHASDSPRYPLIDTAPSATPLGALRVREAGQITRLAWPTVLAMLSHTFMWLVDSALLGRYATVDLAASGLGGVVTWTAYSLFNNLSRINGTFVSQAHGKGDDRAIGDYTWQGLYVALICGLLLQAGGYAADHALTWTRNDPEVLDHAYLYIKWRTASAVFTQVGFCLMGFFQGRRDVMVPMWAGIIGNGLNVVLDLWLIFGWAGFELAGRTWLAVPAMGVEGAAIATSVGTAVSALYQLAWLVGPSEHRRRFAIHRPRRPDLSQLKRIVRVGSPAAFENFVDMSGFTAFMIIVGTLGAAAQAANTIAMHMLSLVFMPMWGLTIAGSVLTGNWIGAGRADQAAAYARQVYKLGLYYMVTLGLVYLAVGGRMFVIFSGDPAVLALGGSLMTVMAVFQLPDGLRMVSVGVLQGAGDTRYPMLASLAVLWLVFVPVTLWIVVTRDAGVTSAWLGATGCYALLAAVLYARFRSNRWQHARIFGDDPAA